MEGEGGDLGGEGQFRSSCIISVREPDVRALLAEPFHIRSAVGREVALEVI